MKVTTKNLNERGNALFLILIAVALFAALSYAVTQSGRSGGGVDKEQAIIAASQLTQYPASIRTGLMRMIITGTTVTALDFSNDTTAEEDEVFHTSGGAMVSQSPPSSSGATAWQYLDMELHATNGYYIFNIGTDTATTGRDIIAVADAITTTVCEQANKGLGLTAAPVTETLAVNLALGTPAGSGAATLAVDAGTGGHIFEAHSTTPQAFACVINGAGGNNVYYHALVEN